MYQKAITKGGAAKIRNLGFVQYCFLGLKNIFHLIKPFQILILPSGLAFVTIKHFLEITLSDRGWSIK